MLCDKKLEKMSLRLIRTEPKIRTIQELLFFGRRRRIRDDIPLGRNLPLDFRILRQKQDQIFLFLGYCQQ